MKKLLKKSIGLGLILSMLATSIPWTISKVDAANKTYDIEYQNGIFTENGNASSKEISDYFTMKKIETKLEEDGTQNGSAITNEGTASIDDSTKNIMLPDSKTTNTKGNHTSYLMKFNDDVTYAGSSRRVESYEVMTASKTNWIGRPNGLMFPFYYDSNLNGYFGLVFNLRSTEYLQYTYAFVGQNREYAFNACSEAKFTSRTDSDGAAIDSSMKISVTYKYSSDGTTIDEVAFSVAECWKDGTTTTVFDNKSLTVVDVISGKGGFLGTNPPGVSGNLTSENCPTRFESEGAIAGVISGNKNSAIAGIKVNLSKSQDEYEKETEAELGGKLPELYQAFESKKSLETAEAYLEIYNQFTDRQKENYADQINSILSWVKLQLVNGSTFTMDKTALEQYPSLLEYIWPNKDTTAQEYTRVNGDIFDMSDVVYATAVFNKSELSSNVALYMLSDLADDSDAYITNHNEFGAVFSNRTVYYNDSEDAEQRDTWALIDANHANLETSSDAGVLYKNSRAYGQDSWGLGFSQKTTPGQWAYEHGGRKLTYDEYTAYTNAEYIGVTFGYTVEEKADAETPHTAIKLKVKMWVDADGDGVCSENEYVLIDTDRTTGGDYIAINYLNGAARVRKAALTDAAFDALHYIKLTRELSEAEAEFSNTYADVLAMNPLLIEPYDLANVTEMLNKVTETFGAVEGIADESLRNTVVSLKNIHDAWDTSDAASKAESFKAIHFADGELKSEVKYAWNVYNRLTADVKALLTAEYAAMKEAMGNNESAQDTVNIACMGDSLTWGAGSINNNENPGDAYPTYLQNKLGTGYSVTNYGLAGMHMVDTSVYDTGNVNADVVLDYSDTVPFKNSLTSGAEIVIIQLGVNDAAYISEKMPDQQETCLDIYRKGLEELIQTYLRLEHSPFIILSNTARNYQSNGKNEVYKNIAVINMKIAEKYGIPCVDMFAKTDAYGDDYTTYYHTDNLHMNKTGYEDMADVFYKAIRSLDKVVETADSFGYEWNENEVNGFLAPELYSATIKNTTVPSEQGLGFKTKINKPQRTGTKIKSYGTIFARYSSNLNLADMTLDNVGNGIYFKADITVDKDGSELFGSSYIAGINCRSNDDFKKVYIARSYIVYEDGTVYYSMNTREDLDSSYSTRTGVLNGYACRAVTGVAKNMIKALAEQGVEVSSVADYNSTTGNITLLPAAAENDAKAIFEFICNH